MPILSTLSVRWICHCALKQQQILMDYNAAARELIEAVKAAKHLQSNLRKADRQHCAGYSSRL